MKKRILLSTYTGLGNFILKTPLISELKKKYPSSDLDILCGLPWGAENVLKNSNFINEILWVDPDKGLISKFFSLKKILRKDYDLIILPFDSSPNFVIFFFNFLAKKSYITAHINFHFKNFKKNFINILFLIFLKNINWVQVKTNRHEIKLNLDLVKNYISEKIDYNIRTVISFEKNNNKVISGDYIVLQPVSRNGMPSPKNWPTRSFYEISKKICNELKGYQVVLLGDSGDQETVEKFKFDNLDCVTSFVGKTNFSQLCNIVQNAKIVIANDSGIMHIADSLNTPLIALYGPTDFHRTRPLSRTSSILFSCNNSLLSMQGFSYTEDQLLEIYPHEYCMNSLDVEDVFEHLKFRLNEKTL